MITLSDREFNAIVETRLDEQIEELIHGIRVEVTEEMAPLYVQAFKKATGRDVTFGEEGFGELGPQDFTPDVVSSAWTERLTMAAQDVLVELQQEFDLRVSQQIRDYKTSHVDEVRDELREQIQRGEVPVEA